MLGPRVGFGDVWSGFSIFLGVLVAAFGLGLSGLGFLGLLFFVFIILRCG